MISPPPLFKEDWNYYEVKLTVKSALFSADNSLTSSAAVLLGNAALPLEWVECRKNISLFERVLRRLFIQSSSHVRLLLAVTFWLNAVKKTYFSKEHRGAYCFSMPRLFGMALFQLNEIGKCAFRKSAAALIFVPRILRVASKMSKINSGPLFK